MIMILQFSQVVILLIQCSLMEMEQILQQNGQVIIKHGQWRPLDKQRRNEGPKGRFNHLTFMYKDNLYVHGGTSTIMEDLDEEADYIYRFTIETLKWDKLLTVKPESMKLQMLNSHCGLLYKNQFVIFGGSNSLGQQKSDLISLNLDTLSWSIMQQKGQIPTPRENAYIVQFNEEYWILYGGLANVQHEIYNDFYFYHVKTKYWTRCEGSYQYLIQARSSFALCLANSSIYIFGGQYQTSSGETHFLNDFYEVNFTIKNNNNIDIKVNRIINDVTPSQRAGHALIALKEKYLILLGGEGKMIKYQDSVNMDSKTNLFAKNDCWLYSRNKQSWFRLETSGEHFKHRCLFGALQYNETIYVFGGIKTYDNILDDTISLKLDLSQIDQQVHNLTSDLMSSCRICFQKKNDMIIWPFALQEQFVDSIVTLMEYPFSAFGLLLDNCIPPQAGTINLTTISYSQKDNCEPYIKIEGGLKMGSVQEYISAIVNFQMGINFYATGIDKKMKHCLMKEALKKEFGLNLKIGSLRLGQSFLYVSISSLEDIRVLLFKKEPLGETTRFQYVCYFYVYDSTTNKVLEGFSEQVKNKVEADYLKFITSSFDKKNSKNTLFIFQLRKIKVGNTEQQEIYPNLSQNDLMYGERGMIFDLENLGYNIYQSVDISLRSYLNLLYLKNQNNKIWLSVKSYDKRQIQPHFFLQKIDRMVKSKHIIQLDGLVNLECKINELYFNPDLKKKVGSFHNGVLIYHRGRLISRYKYPLGTLLRYNFHIPNSNNVNFLGFFGFFEVPDSVPVNMFKTDFIYHIMVEKLFSRFKFAEEFLQRESRRPKSGNVNLVVPPHTELERERSLMNKLISNKEYFNQEEANFLKATSNQQIRDQQNSQQQQIDQDDQQKPQHGQDHQQS